MRTDEQMRERVDGAEAYKARPNGQAAGAPPTDDEEAFGRFFEFPWQFSEPRPPRLIGGLLAHSEEFLVYGPPEAGKSFFLIDMACRWATGDTWRGRAMEQGLVIYLAGERSESVKRRILAWTLRHGFKREQMPVAVLKTSLNLMAPGTDELQQLGQAIKAARRIVGRDVIAIIADTVHSLSPGSKEDNHSFGVLIGQCRRLRDEIGQEVPPALGYVHHTGKNEDLGPRGGNSLPAAVSLSMAISVRLQKYRLVEVDKGNDLAGERPHIEPFVIDDVTLRHEADGTPVKAGVHTAISMADVPSPPEDELKALALKMQAEGKSQRTIASAVGRSVGTVNSWLNAEPAKRSTGKRS